MKIRNKVLITICLVWIAFLALSYAGSRIFLTKSFLDLESRRATEDLSRIIQALNQNNYSLYTFTSDWSHWNDLYDYIQGKNKSFVKNNLVLNAFTTSSINMISYWDLKGKLIIAKAVDLNTQKFVPIPPDLEKYIYPGSQILKIEDLNKSSSGYILLKNGIYMIASSTITDGLIMKPALGTTVNLRFVSEEIIKKIEQTTELSTKLYTLYEIELDNNLQKTFQFILSTPVDQFFQPINDKLLEGFYVLRDIDSKPIGMIRMITPRRIFLTGQKAIHYYSICFLFMGILLLAVLWWLLRLLIIQRLENMARGVSKITENELSIRMNDAGYDELSSVSSGINHMMDIIQASQEKLENRVIERTTQLQNTNLKLEQEIIERKVIEKELLVHKEYLAQLAHYDSLTSLPNRIFFNDLLNEKIHQSSVLKQELAIMFIDLDRFKNINDAFGHHMGDLVLKKIADRFLLIVNEKMSLARLGGDEFIILIQNSCEDSIQHCVKEIFRELAQPICIDSHEFFISVSIGIAIYPKDGKNLEELQQNADLAMYKAKHQGGSSYQYFKDQMNLEVKANVQMEAALRKAITNNEFKLYYQPKFCIKTGGIIGVESLIRWNHPQYGLILPSIFIPLAEETGLIMQIGEWVLHEACRVNKSWIDRGFQPISMAVNVSAKQFRYQDLTKLVSSILDKSRLDPEYLELEITESAVMDNVNAVANKLNDIRNMGVKISVDDFGTGYTSMNYLKQFPVNVLKIDQNFTKGIPDNKNDISIITAVISLAHGLNMEVVAEGIENQKQLQWLADYDCDIAQGYFLSRPLTAEKIILLLTKLKT